MTADTTVELSRAATMMEVGRYDDAARLLANIVAGAPDAARAWCLLSRAHLGAGRAGEAVLAARRAGALNPADDWPHRLASTALLSLGRGPEALAAAAEARRLAPGIWRSHVCVAQAGVAAGEHAVAADGIAQALSIAPAEPDVQFTAGKVALSEGDLQRARRHQEAALAINPGHSGAINELGRISLRERDVSGATGYFLRAARSAPGVGMFGRNAEIALARMLTNFAVLAAALVAIGIDLPTVTPAGPVAAAIAMALFTGLACVYVTVRLRRLPPDGRRHLARMLRRRRWVLTIAAIIGIVGGLAAFAAVVLNLRQPGSSVLLPGSVIAAALAARLLVIMIIRRSRRNVR